MNKILQKWNSLSLIVRIAIGLLIGATLGIIAPKLSFIGIFGDIFVGALKGVAPIMIFILVISSLAKASPGIGKQFRTVILLYMFSTLIGAITAVVASFIFPVHLSLENIAGATNTAPHGIAEVLRNILNNIFHNPIKSLMEGNYIGILAWAIAIGLALKTTATEHCKEAMNNVSDAIARVVRWIINLAPLGIMGLVFVAVSTNGLAIFKDYGKLLCVLVGCMLMMGFVINPLIIFLCIRKNPYPLVLRCFRESGITAFFTRSSAANIPVNLQLCEKLGLDKDVYSVSIPLGATINMDGASITITVMALAAANTLGISVDIPTAIILSVMATLAACGASGVAGGSLLLIPLACSLFGISEDIAMQVVGIGFIIGVVQDSFETMINSAGDVMFAATSEYIEWKKAGKEIKF